MTKRKKSSSQLTLIMIQAPVDLDHALATAFGRDLKHPTKSRPEIADELSALLGRTITSDQLDNWSAPSHANHRLPLDVAVAAQLVTGKTEALSAALKAIDGKVVTGKDLIYLEHSKKLIARQRLDREIEDLGERLK